MSTVTATTLSSRWRSRAKLFRDHSEERRVSRCLCRWWRWDRPLDGRFQRTKTPRRCCTSNLKATSHNASNALQGRLPSSSQVIARDSRPSTRAHRPNASRPRCPPDPHPPDVVSTTWASTVAREPANDIARFRATEYTWGLPATPIVSPPGSSCKPLIKGLPTTIEVRLAPVSSPNHAFSSPAITKTAYTFIPPYSCLHR